MIGTSKSSLATASGVSSCGSGRNGCAMRYLSSAILTVIFGLGAIAILAALVWLLPLLPDPFWPIPLIVMAVPLAMHLTEWRLTKRRVMLSELTHKGGMVHTLFWRGRLLRFGAVL